MSGSRVRRAAAAPENGTSATPLVLTVREAAALARCSEITIRRAIWSGRIRYKRTGSAHSMILIDRVDFLRRFLGVAS